jgi:hypothetical protein
VGDSENVFLVAPKKTQVRDHKARKNAKRLKIQKVKDDQGIGVSEKTARSECRFCPRTDEGSGATKVYTY